MDSSLTPQIVTSLLQKQLSVSIRVCGTSMFPLIVHGSTVQLVALDTTPIQRGDIVAFARADNRLVLHRVIRAEGDKILTQGDSCLHADAPTAKTDIVARAVSTQWSGCTIDLTGRAAHLYGKALLCLSPVSNALCHAAAWAARMLNKVLRIRTNS